MSNTNSSQTSCRGSSSDEIVRELVGERLGRDWCLFLDRDGVINRQVIGDYVRNWQQFEWLPNAQRALKRLRDWAPNLVIVTNQQGIGKGLMSFADVTMIHQNLQGAIIAGGRGIDAFQVCPHLELSGCSCRKPRPGLVLDWLAQHPAIDPSLSIVVGDSLTDLELARNVGAETNGCVSIQIGSLGLGLAADASFESLWDFALAVGRGRA